MSLAPYAMDVARSQGRRHAEPAHPYRDDYHRDRDRNSKRRWQNFTWQVSTREWVGRRKQKSSIGS